MNGRFPNAWLDELYARADIVQTVSAYVPLKKNGARYWGLCPFHHEKTPSFSVNPELNLYHCFGCKAGGTAVHFVQEVQNLSFHEAVELIANRLHMDIPNTIDDPQYEERKRLRQRLLSANKEAARFYHENLWKSECKPILDYLHERGLDDGTIRKFGLGAAGREWDGLTRFLEAKGYTQQELQQAGLTIVKEETRYDMFRDRAIFPIIDAQSAVLGFGGRILGKGQPKYLNTSDTPVFNKRKGVYAANLLKKQRNLSRVILVEGYMDVIAMIQHGINGVVATLGTALTNEQARLLKKYAPEIWVSYDGDSAGQHAIMRALDIFEQEDIPAKVLFFPDNLDPDEYLRQRGIEAFDTIRPLKAPEYRMQRALEGLDLSKEDDRIEYAKRCAKFLKKVSEPVELESYVKALSVQTGFSRDVLLQQIGQSPIEKGPIVVAKPVRVHMNQQNEGVPQQLMSEKTLLNLLAYNLVSGDTVTVDDFSEGPMRQAAASILNGKTPAAILNEAETEHEKQWLSQVFDLDSEFKKENAAEIAADCLCRIRLRRLEVQQARIKEELQVEADPTAKIELLKQFSAISGEVMRLKRSQRKENVF